MTFVVNYLKMKTLEAILQRRTIHSFNAEKVPDSIIMNGLLAANAAPCHRATYPWRFNLVTNTTRSLLFQEYYQIKHKGNLPREKEVELRNRYFNPSNLIIISQILNEGEIRINEDYAACCCAIQNLMVYLRSENVYSKWTTGITTDSQNIYSILKIDSKLERIIGFIWIGYGDKPNDIKRPSIESLIRKI